MYEVSFTETAIRQLKKLEKNTMKRIMRSIERIQIRPYDFVRKLSGSPYFRLRVGDYRVIMDIQKQELRILIVYVGHRRKVYKNIYS